ncbi:hypothetical protein Cgig2_034021 [Carnegiea gigantea]|uniref:Uncharacterized protein n=1 Tax=Carnegiea gigantea TaxID=171969 RepID=A0A9Q1GTZ1_9CARY|nr:hypothetical protein Cgig2_034021 [Carnegiea gigantea]
MNLDLFNVKAGFRRAQALVNLGLKAEAREDLLVALIFDLTNEEVKQELRRIEEMCTVSNERDLVKDAKVNGNNSIESSSKQDDSSAHIEDTKLCIEGDNSSSRSSMRVEEIDHMEELSMEACSSIGLLHDVGTYFQQQICAQKPVGNATRRRSLKLLCLLETAYQRIEQGNSIEFFDKNKLLYMVICIHRSDHQNQQSNIMDGVNQEHHTPIAFQFSAQQNNNIRNQSNVNCNPGKRIKRQRCNGDNHLDQGTHIGRLCGKRKAEGLRFEDVQLISKK